VEVGWSAGGVAGAADVADDGAGGDVADTHVLVGGAVGAVVVGAVVGGESVRDAAEVVVVVLDGPVGDGRAFSGEHVDPLVASAPERSAPHVLVHVMCLATGLGSNVDGAARWNSVVDELAFGIEAGDVAVGVARVVDAGQSRWCLSTLSPAELTHAARCSTPSTFRDRLQRRAGLRVAGSSEGGQA
jgi:hypothetical protein